MKKRMFAALALLLAVLLWGCDGEQPVQTTAATDPTVQTTAATQPETFPVEEDRFYFANPEEMYRLYSQRLDGSDLQLVADCRCENVFRQGERVYYQTGDDLMVYHIPTAQTQTLVQRVTNFEMGENALVYTVPTKEYFISELRYLDLTTNEEISVGKQEIRQYGIGGGKVYYGYYDYLTNRDVLLMFDPQSRQSKTVSAEYSIIDSMIPAEDGVYFSAYVQEKSQWFYAPIEGGEPEPCGWELPNSCSVRSISQQGVCYLDWNSDGNWSDSFKFMDKQGTVTELLTAQPDVSISVAKIENDRYLVTQSKYDPWGPLNEYGYYENYGCQYDCSVLLSDGTLKTVEINGETGKLFANGDFPILDSSTARKPVTAQLYSLFVRNHGYEGREPVCSTTHGAWLNIADGGADLALLAAPTPEEQAYLQEKGVEVEMKLYGGDGLVFIGNAANPVKNLTHEQIIAIYRGEITNWSQVGGPDQPISVYYRDDQSGSQRLFEKLVFKGEQIPDFSSMGFCIMDEMSTIVNIVLSDPYSIGYSIMTYLDDVYAEEDLQVFSVNGVSPSPNTVKDQSYPYNTQGYLVIRSDEPEDSPARRLFDWFGCPLSDDLLTDCSVSPLHED